MDSSGFAEMLAKYADVVVRVGLNLRAGQCLLIEADIEDALFVREVTKSAYRSNIDGGGEMSDEDFQAHGGNDSLIHTDFMIGSNKMDIDGLRADGTSEPIMRKGEWAFGV
jgi:leucyl aminopeptidase (aminopeptidase T)